MKSYWEFKEQVKRRESSDNYSVVNQYGYLGAYQFGMAALSDIGLAVRADPASKSLDHKAFAFRYPLTREIFLSQPVIQDAAFDLHVARIKFDIIRRWPALALNGITLPNSEIVADLSGSIMVVHLLGKGGLMSLLDHGLDDEDGNGTTGLSYLTFFSGYEIF